MLGKMMTKVSLENGPIEPGDPLATSSIPGYVMKATENSKIIGTAFEPFDGSLLSGYGVEEMFDDISDCGNCEKNLRVYPFEEPKAAGTYEKGIIIALINSSFYQPNHVIRELKRQNQEMKSELAILKKALEKIAPYNK